MASTVENKKLVSRWFEGIWGNPGDMNVIDELGAEDLFFHYPMHGPLKGREATKQMVVELRESFPDVVFWPVGELIAEGEYVVGRWEGGGTHTGKGYKLAMGSLPDNTGKKMHFTGTSVIRIKDGKVVEDIGEEGVFTALKMLGVIKEA